MSDDIQMCCNLYLISYWYFMSVYIPIFKTCLVVSAIIVTLLRDIGHRTCRCSPYIYLVHLSSMFLFLCFVVKFIFILDKLSGKI